MQPLPHESLLSTLAEMGVAVVGFSLVVGILRPKSPDDQERLFTVREVAEIGLICAVMSMVPAVAHSYGMSADSAWRLSSGVHLVWVALVIPASARRRGAQAGFMFLWATFDLGRGKPPA